MECVTEEWVVDLSALPVGRGDGDLRKGDNLCRRHRVYRPVPERLAEIHSSLLPAALVDRVSLGDIYSVLLQDLLYVSAS